MTETLSTGPVCARPGCGRALPKAATGHPALHCSPACRQAEHRRRRLEEELPALRDEARALLARLGGDEQAQRALEGLDGGQVAVFVRHARTARAALDGAFALLGLPAPTLDQAARERQDDTAASALAAAPAGRGKSAQVHGQQAVPEALLTAFQNACGAGADERGGGRPVPDGDHGHGEGPDRGRAPATEPERVRTVLPPDTRPLPTTAYDELRPTHRARPKTPDHPAGGTPDETDGQTTRTAGADTEQPGPARPAAPPAPVATTGPPGRGRRPPRPEHGRWPRRPVPGSPSSSTTAPRTPTPNRP
ncbi:hypothetical protein ACFRPV_33075 [Kitasatospora sp. NPDC056808]|uniref:hypothetical protein n=1 Tax=Kitasatospora sp. NPDC056789 TaxID=3345945 RepID=UPI0036C14C4A